MDNRESNISELSMYMILLLFRIYIVQKKIGKKIDFTLNTLFLLLKLIFEFEKTLRDKLRLDYPRVDYSVKCSITLKT